MLVTSFVLTKLLCDPSRFDCSNNQFKELPNSLGRCSDLSELKVIGLLGLIVYAVMWSCYWLNVPQPCGVVA